MKVKLQNKISKKCWFIQPIFYKILGALKALETQNLSQSVLRKSLSNFGKGLLIGAEIRKNLIKYGDLYPNIFMDMKILYLFFSFQTKTEHQATIPKAVHQRMLRRSTKFF